MIDASKEKANMEKQLGPKEGRVAEKATHFDKLDPGIIGDEPRAAPMEKLESFEVGFHEPQGLYGLIKACHRL